MTTFSNKYISDAQFLSISNELDFISFSLHIISIINIDTFKINGCKCILFGFQRNLNRQCFITSICSALLMSLCYFGGRV